jgi:hypothetical protein
MASVERRNGRWRVRYRTPDGLQRSATFDRKADAERFAKGIDTDQARGHFVDLNRGRVTLAEWSQQWRATTVHLRPSTAARDDSYLRTHVIPAFGARPLRSIEHVEVQAWVAELSRRRARATVAKAFQILAKILDSAVTARMIAANPCRGVKLPKIEREEMRFLAPDEIARLADAIHPRYRSLVLVAAYGGFRIGELAGLKRHRVDVLRRRVEVAEIAVEVKGRVVWGAPKTRAARRSVSLPRPVVDELSEHLTTWAGEELVFTSPAGTVLRTPTWRRRFWSPPWWTPGSRPSGRTTSGTPRSRSGSLRARTSSRSHDAPATRRRRSRSTATGTSSPRPTTRSATVSATSTPRRNARRWRPSSTSIRRDRRSLVCPVCAPRPRQMATRQIGNRP